MITKEQFKKTDNELFKISMLLKAMLGALRNFEKESTQCGEIICLGEVIEERIKNVLYENDKILLEYK
jgi:hypothetical protein